MKQEIKLPAGKRLTVAKQTIVDFLFNNPGHYTAEQVYKILRDQQSHLGVATVYRNLNDLVDLGILNRLSYSQLPAYYECARAKHAHFFCEHCQKIYDWDFPSLNFGQARLGHRIKEINIELRGICQTCVQKFLSEQTNYN